MKGRTVATISTTSGSELNRYPQFLRAATRIALEGKSAYVAHQSATHVLTKAKTTLMIRQARLDQHASQALPAPRRLPHRTAAAIPMAAGTW